MKEITLKYGSKEADVLVAAHLLTLDMLLKENPSTFYELVMLCRDKDHVLFSDACRDELRSWNLLQGDDTVHNSTRNIVLSSVTGEGLDMTLVSPIATE